MGHLIKIERLTPAAFQAFGAVVVPDKKVPTLRSEELTFWQDVCDHGVGPDSLLGFLRLEWRPYLVHRLERHLKACEVFIPLEGVSLFPVAPPARSDKTGPDLDQVRTFLIDGSSAIRLNKGTWHWAPFPVTEVATYMLLLRKGTVEDDCDIRELAKPLEVDFDRQNEARSRLDGGYQDESRGLIRP